MPVYLHRRQPKAVILVAQSDGIAAIRHHDDIQSQNAVTPCRFNRQFCDAVDVSLIKNRESISADDITPQNCAC